LFKKIIVLFVALQLIGCSEQVKTAKHTLEEGLVNKEDVEYREIKTYPGNVVCGEFSAFDIDYYRSDFKQFIVREGVAREKPTREDWLIFCSDDSAGSLLENLGIGPFTDENGGLMQVYADLKSLKVALQGYRTDNNRYPSTLAEIVEKHLKDVPDDPWGRSYVYDNNQLGFGVPGPYKLYTLGADGVKGGRGENADIGNSDLKYLGHIESI
jgi:general secretion pathway protein G